MVEAQEARGRTVEGRFLVENEDKPRLRGLDGGRVLTWGHARFSMEVGTTG